MEMHESERFPRPRCSATTAEQANDVFRIILYLYSGEWTGEHGIYPSFASDVREGGYTQQTRKSWDCLR